MRRVFAIDVLEYPRCHGRMRIVAAIHPPEAAAARGAERGLGTLLLRDPCARLLEQRFE